MGQGISGVVAMVTDRKGNAGSATKHYDRATNAHFRPDNSRGATGKSLIVLDPSLSLNQLQGRYLLSPCCISGRNDLKGSRPA